MAIVSALDTRRHDDFAALARRRVADRDARLVPRTRLAFADLHNHSHLSDGDGDVEVAFDAMRDAGLDIGALTDHSRLGWGLPLSPVGSNEAHPCRQLLGIDDDAWRRIGALADAADSPGDFVAIRGFEWTSPGLGHMNVWDSAAWIDPLHTESVQATRLGNRLELRASREPRRRVLRDAPHGRAEQLDRDLLDRGVHAMAER